MCSTAIVKASDPVYSIKLTRGKIKVSNKYRYETTDNCKYVSKRRKMSLFFLSANHDFYMSFKSKYLGVLSRLCHGSLEWTFSDFFWI